MRKRKTNKILGIILAITLPLSIIGAVASAIMTPVNISFGTPIHWGMDSIFNSGSNGASVVGEKYTGIDSIQVSNLSAKVIIQASNTDETWVEYDGDQKLTISQRGSTLELKEKGRGHHMFSMAEKRGTTKIYLSASVKDAELKLGVSQIDLNDLTFDNLEINGGVVDVYLKNINVKNKLEIEGGVGKIELNDVTANILDLELGVGSMDCHGVVAENVNVDGGVGSINFSKSTINKMESKMGIGKLNLTDTEVKNHRER